MDEPYKHGMYVNLTRLAEVHELGSKITDLQAFADGANLNHTQRVNRLRSELTEDPNKNVCKALIGLGEKLSMAPHSLEDILTGIIPSHFDDDEFINSRLREILVYVKLTYAEEINEDASYHLEACESLTKSRMSQSQDRFKGFKTDLNRKMAQIDEKLAKVNKTVTQEKEWFVSRINRIFAMTGGKTEFMADSDVAIINELEQRGLIGMSGAYKMVNRDSIMFMNNVEFCELTKSLFVLSTLAS